MPDEPEDILLAYINIDMAAAIGRAIAAWALLEYEIDQVIWQLARLEPEIGACLTAQFSTVVVRLNCLLSLAQLHGMNSSHIGKLRKFRDRAGGLAERRNRIAHDPWFYGFDTKTLYRLHKTAKARLEFAYKVVTEEELMAFESEIASAMERFSDLRSKLLHDFWSLP